jgi:hypothetical protein
VSISLYFTNGTTALNIGSLSENDISFVGEGNLAGITKGALSAGATGHYTLPVSGFSTSGSVNISVSKTGYTFTGIPHNSFFFPITLFASFQRERSSRAQPSWR